MYILLRSHRWAFLRPKRRYSSTAVEFPIRNDLSHTNTRCYHLFLSWARARRRALACIYFKSNAKKAMCHNSRRHNLCAASSSARGFLFRGAPLHLPTCRKIVCLRPCSGFLAPTLPPVIFHAASLVRRLLRFHAALMQLSTSLSLPALLLWCCLVAIGMVLYMLCAAPGYVPTSCLLTALMLPACFFLDAQIALAVRLAITCESLAILLS